MVQLAYIERDGIDRNRHFLPAGGLLLPKKQRRCATIGRVADGLHRICELLCL